MAESNEYNDLSVFQAIKRINGGTLIIPDIQRDYCWSPFDIEELYRSIIDKFPIGSFIVWRTKGKNLNGCSSDFFKFLDEVWRKQSKFVKAENKLLDKNFVDNMDYDVILDGQQRLTSFYLTLCGEYHIKQGSGKDNKESNYIIKELYYNLDRYIQTEDSEIDPRPFVFLTKEEAEQGNYYRVKDLLIYENDEDAFCTHIDDVTRGYPNNKSAKELKLLFRRLNEESRDKSLIHFYTINSDQYDEALDVFVRVNSTGVKLNKTDLLFGTLINKWPKDNVTSDGRRKEIEKYLKSINSKYNFNITKDFFLRVCLVLANDGKSGVSMQEIAKSEVVQKIRESWSKIKSSTEACLKVLKDIDLNDEKMLAYNALIPIVYYIFKGGKFSHNDYVAREELKKYFAISFAKGLFGGSSDTAITNACSAIRNNLGESFNIGFFKNTEFSGQRNFNVDIALINKWLEKYNKGSKTYLLLMLLSPNLNLLEDSYDQDHSHADTLFNDKYLKSIGVPEEKWDLWKEKRNKIPNLSFMQSSRNRSKNKTDLDTWIKEHPDKVSSLKTLPIDVSYKLKDFEHFFVLRRSMMKYILTSLFGTAKEDINVGDEVTLNTMLMPPHFGIKERIEYGAHGHVKSSEKLSWFDGDNMVEEILVGFENEDGEYAQHYVPIQFLYVVEPFDKKYEF